jgi:hypothetical protein
MEEVKKDWRLKEVGRPIVGMKSLPLSLIALSGIATAAQAQLGLTLKECDAKYGEATLTPAS